MRYVGFNEHPTSQELQFLGDVERKERLRVCLRKMNLGKGIQFKEYPLNILSDMHRSLLSDSHVGSLI